MLTQLAPYACRSASTKVPTRCAWSGTVLIEASAGVGRANPLMRTVCHFLQITRGLLQKYGPDRVKDTPITEVG